jgi:hypothetical protein
VAIDKQTQVKPPSVGEIVRAISEEAMMKPVIAPMTTVLHLPKPHPLSRLLVVLSVLLIGILAVLLVLMTHHVNGLVNQIRVDQDLRNNPTLPPLPTADALVDDKIFALALMHYPKDAMRLYCARAETLMQRGDATAAIACYKEANVRLDNDLPASGRIELSRALMLTGQFDHATRELRTLNFELLSATDLATANDLLSRVLFAQQSRDRRTVAQSAMVKPR